MKKILVTGCAGFIGSHLTEYLLLQKNNVIGIDNLSNGKLKNLESFQHQKNFNFINCDINNDKINYILDEVDVVYHLAALADIVPSIQNPSDYFQSNVNGTFNLIKNCKNKNKKIKKFIYAASSSCYGIPKIYPTPESSPIDPQYPYALTKRLAQP